MNRRTFIKALGALVAGLATGMGLVKPKPKLKYVQLTFNTLNPGGKMWTDREVRAPNIVDRSPTSNGVLYNWPAKGKHTGIQVVKVYLYREG